MASPVLAEEALYCVDTAATGFKWDEQRRASPAMFKEQRFTVRIESETKRTITETTGLERVMSYECKQRYGGVLDRRTGLPMEDVLV
jgi:hypothetical protein